MGRLLRHLFFLPGTLARAFPADTLAAIEQAIAAAERRHGGQIRFAVEGALEVGELLRGRTARERAVEVFSSLRVWDTEANNGVLLYLLLADRDVEIVADRGYNGRVSPAQWEEACRAMERSLAAGRFEEGIVAGVGRIAELAARHFPPRAAPPDELDNRPAVL